MRRAGAAIRIEVSDGGGVWLARPGDDGGAWPARPGGDEHGRGLLIVGALAARWGVAGPDRAGRRTVWFVTRAG